MVSSNKNAARDLSMASRFEVTINRGDYSISNAGMRYEGTVTFSGIKEMLDNQSR